MKKCFSFHRTTKQKVVSWSNEKKIVCFLPEQIMREFFNFYNGNDHKPQSVLKKLDTFETLTLVHCFEIGHSDTSATKC